MSHSKLVAPELAAIEITGLSRSAFIMRGALAAGAVYGTSLVSPFAGRALAQSGGGDVDVLNFALTLEELEAAFYEQGVERTKGLGDETRALTREIRDNEREHVDALRATIKQLGGTAVKAPGVDFGDAFTDERAFLKLAQTLEDTGVSAYNGAAPQIESKDVLAAAGGIVQVEARHAALIRLRRDQDPAPRAFDRALESDAVLKAVQPFVTS